MKAAPVYFFVTGLIYFFTYDASLWQVIKNPSSLLDVTRDAQGFEIVAVHVVCQSLHFIGGLGSLDGYLVMDING